MSDSDAGPKVRDVCVIYRDKTNTDEWVGHALLTDQVVVGVSVLDAYIELRKALTALLLDALEDNDLPSIYSPTAPRDKLLEILATASPLPKEIEEIADMRLRGEQADLDAESISSLSNVERVCATLSVDSLPPVEPVPA